MVMKTQQLLSTIYQRTQVDDSYRCPALDFLATNCFYYSVSARLVLVAVNGRSSTFWVFLIFPRRPLRFLSTEAPFSIEP